MTEQRSKVLIRILAVVAGLVGLCVVAWSWFAFRPTGIGKLEAMVAVAPRSSPTIVSGGVPTIFVPDGSAVAPPPEVLPPEALRLLGRMGRASILLGSRDTEKADAAMLEAFASVWLPMMAEWEFFPHETLQRSALEAGISYAATIALNDFQRTTTPLLNVRMFRDLAHGRDDDAMAAFRIALSRTDLEWRNQGLLEILNILEQSPRVLPEMLDEMESAILIELQEVPPLEARLPRIMAFRDQALHSLANPRTGQGILGNMWNGIMEKALQAAAVPLVENEIEVLCVAWAERDERAFDAAANRLDVLTEMAGSRFYLPGGNPRTSRAKGVFEAEIPDPSELKTILLYLSAIRFRSSHDRWPEVHELTDLERLRLVEKDVRWVIHNVDSRMGAYVDRREHSGADQEILWQFYHSKEGWPTSFEELNSVRGDLDPEEWRQRFRSIAGRPVFGRYDGRDEVRWRIIIPQVFSDELKSLLAGEDTQ